MRKQNCRWMKPFPFACDSCRFSFIDVTEHEFSVLNRSLKISVTAVPSVQLCLVPSVSFSLLKSFPLSLYFSVSKTWAHTKECIPTPLCGLNNLTHTYAYIYTQMHKFSSFVINTYVQYPYAFPQTIVLPEGAFAYS